MMMMMMSGSLIVGAGWPAAHLALLFVADFCRSSCCAFDKSINMRLYVWRLPNRSFIVVAADDDTAARLA